MDRSDPQFPMPENAFEAMALLIKAVTDKVDYLEKRIKKLEQERVENEKQ